MTTSDGSTPKQWELRAALRALARAKANSRFNPAKALVAAANEIVGESDDFTVKQVAERAGVAVQTFYNTFGSKDELILAMIEEGIGERVDLLVEYSSAASDPIERLRRLIQGGFRDPLPESVIRRNLWRARERQRLVQRLPREVDSGFYPYRSALVAALNDARFAGVIRSEDPALDAVLIQQQVAGTIFMVTSGGTEYTLQQLGERLWAMIWRGLAPRDDHLVEKSPDR